MRYRFEIKNYIIAYIQHSFVFYIKKLKTI